jgi:hypothetical protein
MFRNADRDKARAARLDCTFANRDLFSIGEIATGLAREPGRARIDKNERAQAARDLADAIIRKEFDLSGESEIVRLTSEPPYFRPFGPEILQEFAELIRRPYPADGLEVFLRRDACRRYLEKSSLRTAPGLLNAWFPETSDTRAGARDRELLQPETGSAVPGAAADELRPAPAREIHKAIAAAYDRAEAADEKPPNLREIVPLVQAILRAGGYDASGRRIQENAGDDRHNNRRRKPGKTVASERSGKQP